MVETRLVDRLTASDLFMLWADDFGWSQDIGVLAILDGTRLLDPDGRVRIQAVRRAIEPRLSLVPRFRQLLDRPRRGLGWPLWVDAPAFDLADHVQVSPLAAPGDQAQLLQACAQLYGRRLDPSRPLWEATFLPGLPAQQVGLFLRAHHTVADGVAGVAAFGALLDLAADAPTPAAAPWTPAPLATTGAGAGGGWVAGCRAWPIRAGDSAARRRCGGSSSPSAPPAPASTARSAPTASWPSSAAAWISPSRSPTPTTPRSTTWCWPPSPAACASCWPAVASPSKSWCCARWCPSRCTRSSRGRRRATRTR